MKFNWRSFVFSLGVLLFALIAVNLMASGVKMEGFQEGAVDNKGDCNKAVTSINDFTKAVKDSATSGKLIKNNNIEYSQFSSFQKKEKNSPQISGQCDRYVRELPEVKPLLSNLKPIAAAAPKAPVPKK